MAATKILSESSRARKVRRRSRRKALTSSSLMPARSLRSAPAQKALSPAPVITTARSSRFDCASSIKRSSSARMAREMALRRASPSMVQTSIAPPSRDSTRNSAISALQRSRGPSRHSPPLTEPRAEVAARKLPPHQALGELGHVHELVQVDPMLDAQAFEHVDEVLGGQVPRGARGVGAAA